MFTAKYIDSDEVIDITKISNPYKDLRTDGLVCRWCNQKVFIKAGEIREAHFCHLVKCKSNIQRHPESLEHLYGKRFIVEHILRTYSHYTEAQVHYEFHFPQINRIADIAFLFPNGHIIVHEIQLSPISIEELEKRTKDYERAAADVRWWLGKSANSIYNKEWCFERFGESCYIDYKRIRQLSDYHRA